MRLEEYLATSFPDGDREYLDGVVVERNIGDPVGSQLAQMDPEDRTTFVYSSGSLTQRELEGFDVPEGGFLPFNTREIFSLLDEELA